MGGGVTDRVLIIGASSGIAQAVAAELAKLGTELVLAARDVGDCERIAQDLRTRFGIKTACVRFDALDYASHEAMFREAEEKAGGKLTGVIVCHGLLGTQDEAVADFAHARAIIDVNYTSFVSVLTIAANLFESRRDSFICAIGSIAGDRGRQSNYVYGSSKAAVATFMQGLRNRMQIAGGNVAVITVKPGFVDTKMTRHLGRTKLVVQPDVVARDIVKAIRKRKSVLYTPLRWRFIMAVIRMIPEPIFKRMKL